MDSFSDKYKKIEIPISNERKSSSDIILGKRFDPISQIKLYPAEEYEIFIAEWASTIENRYAGVFKSKGGGDKGQDVVGFYGSVPSDDWDNYQCKHYDSPLAPATLKAEIVKIVYYVYTKEYTAPRKHYFVAPQGLSNQSLSLIRNSSRLKEEILDSWDSNCPDENLKVSDLALKNFVENFDYSKFSFIEPQDLVNEHKNCVWHPQRFGGGLIPRPISNTPDAVDALENVYITELKNAYEEKEGRSMSIDEIRSHIRFGSHFSRQRRFFYSAESLRQFARDQLPGDGDFGDLQNQIHDGVIEVVEAEYENALARVDETLKVSKIVEISDHVLKSKLEPADRGGICHQLVNEKRIKWSKGK